MLSYVPRPGSEANCLHRPTCSRCLFERLIRNFSLNGGNNASASSTPKSSANGTIGLRPCMAGLIEQRSFRKRFYSCTQPYDRYLATQILLNSILCQRLLSILVIATSRTPVQQSRVSFSIRSQEKESSTRVRHRAAKRLI